MRLERGDATGVSESVLDGIAQALQLDEAERAHLLDLFRTAGTPRRAAPPAAPGSGSGPTVQRFVDSMTARQRSSSTADSTSSPPTPSAAPCSHRSSPTRTAAEQRPLRLPRPAATEFFRDWDRSPTTPSPCCAPRPAATPTTGSCPT